MKKVSILNICIINFLYSLAANFAHPVTPTFIQNLGLHDYMFGLAFACMSFTNFFFSPFWGKMSKNYGSSNILTFGLIGYGCMQFLFGASTAEWQICLARLGGGFFIGAVSVSQLVYVVDNSSQQGKDLAILATINLVTSQFGFLIGGFLGDVSIKLTFNVQAISLAAIGVITFLILKDSKIEHSDFSIKEINPFAAFVNCKDILNYSIIFLLLITVFSSFAKTCYEQCFNYYIKDIFNFPTSYNGIVKAIIGFVTFAINTFITMKLINKTDTNRSVVLVNVFIIILILGVVLIDNFMPFMIVNILFFGFCSMFTPILQDMLTKHKTSKQAELVGFYNAISMLGSVFGSLLAGFIYSSGPKLSFVVSAITLVMSLACSIIHINLFKKDYQEI